jgi:hypothetical protein
MVNVSSRREFLARTVPALPLLPPVVPGRSCYQPDLGLSKQPDKKDISVIFHSEDDYYRYALGSLN